MSMPVLKKGAKALKGALLLLSLHCYISASESDDIETRKPKKNWNKKVLIVSIPKSGTHLLGKILSLMNVEGGNFHYTKSRGSQGVKDTANKVQPELIDAFKNGNRFVVKHLSYTPETEIFVKDKINAGIINIRDPRAQLVSFAHSVQKHRIGADQRSIEDLLIDFILARKENFLVTKKHKDYTINPPQSVLCQVDFLWFIGAYEFYKLFIPWTQVEGFYTIKFESVVGSNGGGSDESQVREIKNLARHLNHSITDEQVARIVEEAFGGSATFREGQIDSWKKYFTPAVTAAFKSKPELLQLLIDLGYEKDNNW